MEQERIFRILRDGSDTERAALIESLPDNLFKSAALALINSGTPGMRVVALGPMIIKYCAGMDPETGSALAWAAHRLAVELYERGGGHGLLPMTLSNLAFQHVNALNLLGRAKDVIDFVDRWLPFYVRIDERENLPALKTARIGALVNLQRVDDAEAALKDPALRGNPATDIEIERLDAKVRRLKADLTGVGSTAETGEADNKKLTDAIEKSLKALGTLSGTGRPAAAGIRPETSKSGDAGSADRFRGLLESLEIGERYLAGNGNVKSEWTLKKILRECTGIFVLEKTPTEAKIRDSLARLESALSDATEMELSEVRHDALWGMYLCHSRLGSPSQAADALMALRAGLERLRNGIKDPLKRGGVFGAYPHLFDALCAKLVECGRTEDLLSAIEGARGRGIADILTSQAKAVIKDQEINDAVAELPALTKRHQFHYLGYYVDADATYGVLVSKKGTIHALNTVPISRDHIREIAEFVDPRLWGKPVEYDPSLQVPEVSRELAPLVSGLDDLLDADVLRKGDHICYSADDSFNNVPLNYLAFRDGRLADFFTASRIHNAFHLRHVLTGNVMRPTSFLALAVLTRQDVASDADGSFRDELARPVNWLRDHAEGIALENDAASITALIGKDLCDKVIHLSTHGVFPGKDPRKTPFRDSGLVIPAAGELPDRDEIAQRRHDDVLTPEKILEYKLDFSGSHLSVMACVSGLSREGVGGDALGMDWAFVQAGASSILSSHWDVDVSLSAVFFERFYREWIDKGASRGQAYRAAMNAMRSDSAGGDKPYGWAAFSLTGDWR